MTETPDLRTLAAELAQVMRDANTVDAWDVTRGLGPNFVPFGHFAEVAIAWMHAAVLPAHRRQVLAEVAEVPVEHPASANVIQRATIEVGAEQLRKAIRRLASVAPETAPTPRHEDETAPAVGREAAQAQGPAEGAAPDRPRTWQLPDDRERAKAAIHQPLHDLNVRIVGLQVGDCHCNLIAEVVLDSLTDATPADGQDGDGHG